MHLNRVSRHEIGKALVCPSPGTVKTLQRFVDSSNKDVCNNCPCHCIQLDSALKTLSPARSQVATVKKCYGVCTQEDCLPNNAACVDKESGLQLSHNIHNNFLVEITLSYRIIFKALIEHS